MTSVVVTGAGRGIGLAIARHLSERGWDVYATAQAVLPKLRAARGRVVFMSSVSRACSSMVASGNGFGYVIAAGEGLFPSRAHPQVRGVRRRPFVTGGRDPTNN